MCVRERGACINAMHVSVNHYPTNVRCRCQNRRTTGRGSRTVRLGSMVIGDRGHDVYPGSGPLYGGNTLPPA